MSLDRDGLGYLEAFEQGTLPADGFDHAAHVYAAWCCFQRYGATDGRRRFVVALKRFVARHGADDKYHETITLALLDLIAHRAGSATDWESFCRENRDILEDGLGLLLRYYSRERLFSERARGVFVPPDLRPLPVDQGAAGTPVYGERP